MFISVFSKSNQNVQLIAVSRMPNFNVSVFCLDRSESDENGESQEQKDYKREFFDMLDEVKHVTKLICAHVGQANSVWVLTIIFISKHITPHNSLIYDEC